MTYQELNTFALSYLAAIVLDVAKPLSIRLGAFETMAARVSELPRVYLEFTAAEQADVKAAYSIDPAEMAKAGFVAAKAEAIEGGIVLKARAATGETLAELEAAHVAELDAAEAADATAEAIEAAERATADAENTLKAAKAKLDAAKLADAAADDRLDAEAANRNATAKAAEADAASTRAHESKAAHKIRAATSDLLDRQLAAIQAKAYAAHDEIRTAEKMLEKAGERYATADRARVEFTARVLEAEAATADAEATMKAAYEDSAAAERAETIAHLAARGRLD